MFSDIAVVLNQYLLSMANKTAQSVLKMAHRNALRSGRQMHSVQHRELLLSGIAMPLRRRMTWRPNVLNAASKLLGCFCHGAVVKSLALSPRESIKQASSAEKSQESLLIAGEMMERIDQMGTAYEAWVTAREKVAKELPPLILENPNDDLIRALIAQEVVAHRHFIAARDRKNGA